MKPKTLFIICILAGSIPLLVFGEDAKRSSTVNQVAAKPADHLGALRIIGVVATVTPGKGFLLVDEHEYSECGLSCLKESGTKRIPVQWGGDSPKLEQLVQVQGILSRSDKGLSFAAEKIDKP